MFDLENAVVAWKSRLAEAGAMTRDNVAELEEHLHELVAKLSTQGLSSQEAFAVATMRLGTPTQLNVEFDKVNGQRVWPKRILWMLCGYLGGIAIAQVVSGFSALALTLARLQGVFGAPAGAISVLVAGICWAIVLFALFYLARRRYEGAAHGVSMRWLAALAFAAVVGVVMTQIGAAWHATLATQPQLTEWALWNAFGGVAVQLGVIVACVVMAVCLRRSEGELVL